MKQRLVVGTVLVAALVWGTAAQAALGGDAGSVQADVAAAGALARTTELPQYVQQEYLAGGVRVREYLDHEGTVFAVSWMGPVMPDMRALLGVHFAAYTAALAALTDRGSRRSLRLALPGVVVESSGHMRAFAGRAYFPEQLPSGVALAELN
ncbi:MAG TPA: DUF2844 domain-containing protein [Steroidobacteraceae bacterium]